MSAPPIVIQQAAEAAAAANESQLDLPSTNPEEARGREKGQYHHERNKPSPVPHSNDAYNQPDDEAIPPPPYNSVAYGQMDLDQSGLETNAVVEDDGRVNIKINQRNRALSNILVPALRHQLDLHKTQTEQPQPEIPIPQGLGGDELPVPPMNIVIQIVGSRGDVQPYVALGQVLKRKFGHRVRVATHPTFRDFVTENGLEFFSIGGDPAELMAFMVKNPGLMPGIDTLKSGDISKRRRAIYEMITGCWRSCIEAGDGTGFEASDALIDDRGSFESAIPMGSNARPFVADAIIANPPSFAHVHIAEKLGIPLHLTFTMPWSPTQSFPHPLANIVSTNAEKAMTNFVSYALVDMMTWQGLGDIINRFREKSLGLEPLSIMWAPGMTSRLKIPYTYCWSPALIPKPKDWGANIDISGFYFLDLATNYTPAPDLKEFLDAGPPPVYIGFGSIVVDDPNAMTKMIFEAVKKSGQRALVSKGWGGLGADDLGIPDGVFMLGNVPHDWLFQHVSCVVHHGGAGTTAAGIRAGRPTVVVPFFGDQPFWGAMVARAGAGPPPIAYKQLTAEKLTEQILHAIRPESLTRAAELSSQISNENGTETGADQFHEQLKVNSLRCSLAPDRVAVWRVKRTDIRLSAFAATVLGNEGLLEFSDLKLYRPREYETETGPWDPISGGASALIGTLGNLGMGVADFPIETFRALRQASVEVKERHSNHRHGSETPKGDGTSTPRPSVSDDRASISSTPSLLTPTSSHMESESRENLPESDVSSVQDLKREVSEPSSQPLSPQASSTQPPSTQPQSFASNFNHRHSLRSLSRNSSRSPSRDRGQTRRSDSPAPNAASELTLESVIGAGKGVSRIVSVGLKSPMDFTMGLAKGFHNAPKLYGDDTVRQPDKITGIQSGLKAAGRELTFGFYDGITGLVTQPLRGAEKEGAAGFFKGAAKGFGGLILKPGAGIWGIPGYTFKGVYTELQKLFGSSVHNYIIAARTAQGYDEWQASTPQQRADIITIWKSGQVELRKHGRKYGKDKTEAFEKEISKEDLPRGFTHTRHMSFDERKRLADEKKRRTDSIRPVKSKTEKESGGRIKSRCKYCPFHHGDDVQHAFTFPGIGRYNKHEHDYETAVQESVSATSKGNPEEDQIIARALRASVQELHAAQQSGDHDAAYERAVAASVAEARRARAEAGIATKPGGDGAEDHDEDLAKALKASLGHDQSGRADASETVPHRIHMHDHNDDTDDSGLGTDDDEMYRQAIEESKRQHTAQANKGPTTDEHDEELSRAMTESEQAHADQAKKQTEEEIVLEHVKKQSLMEEEQRKKMEDPPAAGGEGNADGNEDHDLKAAIQQSLKDLD